MMFLKVIYYGQLETAELKRAKDRMRDEIKIKMKTAKWLKGEMSSDMPKTFLLS